MSVLVVKIDLIANESAIVVLNGPGDIAGAGVLERQLTFLSAKHSKHVVFDCAGLTFLSSLGRGVLMQFRRGITARGGRVTLAAVQPGIKSALTHAGLDKLLPMFPTVDEALASPAQV